MDSFSIQKSISPQFSLNIKDLKISKGLNFILGPNGSGKTSLLKEIVRQRGGEANNFYLPAENQIDLELSLKELLEILETPLPNNLSSFQGQLSKKLVQFSSGQRQRIVINLVSQLKNRTNIFLDEPTNYLDLHYKFEFMDILKNSTNNYLVSTNDFSWCIQFSSANAILLSNGTVLSQAPLRELIESPEMHNAFQMQFRVKEESNSNLLQLVVDRDEKTRF